MDHPKIDVLDVKFVIFIFNRQKVSVMTSLLLDKCFGHRKDILAYTKNFSSKCAVLSVLGEKKKPKKLKKAFEGSYFVLNSQCLFMILAGLGFIWYFCMSSCKKAQNSYLLHLSYVRIQLQTSYQLRTGPEHLAAQGSSWICGFVFNMLLEEHTRQNICIYVIESVPCPHKEL